MPNFIRTTCRTQHAEEDLPPAAYTSRSPIIFSTSPSLG
jgi:hypothetical protein